MFTAGLVRFMYGTDSRLLCLPMSGSLTCLNGDRLHSQYRAKSQSIFSKDLGKLSILDRLAVTT